MERKLPNIQIKFGPVISEFIYSVMNGLAREFGVFGPRGEAKTIGAFGAMIHHSVEHEKHGYKLPVPWMGVTDFHRSHKEKTKPSLEKDFWQGAWRLHDDDRVAIYRDDKERVKLSLFGIEDQGAVDRVRKETCGYWVEEPAPATTGPGVDETTWNTGITSQRIQTHAKIAMFSTNYPDEDHWCWTRMNPHPSKKWGFNPADETRMYFRVPKGDNEYVSDADRREWAHALRDRPDLVARLIEGKPGSVQLGKSVAVYYIDGKPAGFNESKHVSTDRVRPIKNQPIYIGLDFGHTPAAIIGQFYRGQILVLAALPCEFGGIRQHLESSVIPWLRENAPWAVNDMHMIPGAYDPAGNTEEQADTDQSPIAVINEMLPGFWEEGPISWEGRKGPLFTAFNRAIGGEAALRIDPVDALPLIKALNGRWYYKTDRNGKVIADKPYKDNHPWSDLGDAFCYMLGRMGPSTVRTYKAPIIQPGSYDPRVAVSIVKTDFDIRRM